MDLSFPRHLPHLVFHVLLGSPLLSALRFAHTSCSSNLSVERRLHFDGDGQYLARSKPSSRVNLSSSPNLSGHLVILQCNGMDWLPLPSFPI
ncbi:hypothetical protein BDP81DRAFT_423475 [Colletotrichum phormii]|uniref:Secreted protein n=1 Tax=Colletotrichum phormii TaxID=359342 RepID=A0AAJ0EHD3_9PEZI|nr:uncharacterized protein BDP81DRAFT_423475 [Colletotrichum phormii]KAK1639113.1 hypothetical protein BDP81DRAFT_423475 [Colletotrichum phormii]